MELNFSMPLPVLEELLTRRQARKTPHVCQHFTKMLV